MRCLCRASGSPPLPAVAGLCPSPCLSLVLHTPPSARPAQVLQGAAAQNQEQAWCRAPAAFQREPWRGVHPSGCLSAPLPEAGGTPPWVWAPTPPTAHRVGLCVGGPHVTLAPQACSLSRSQTCPLRQRQVAADSRVMGSHTTCRPQVTCPLPMRAPTSAHHMSTLGHHPVPGLPLTGPVKRLPKPACGAGRNCCPDTDCCPGRRFTREAGARAG